MDRDQMMNLVAQSSDNHMRFIDAREDLLMTRANNWRDQLVQGTNEWENIFSDSLDGKVYLSVFPFATEAMCLNFNNFEQ